MVFSECIKCTIPKLKTNTYRCIFISTIHKLHNITARNVNTFGNACLWYRDNR